MARSEGVVTEAHGIKCSPNEATRAPPAGRQQEDQPSRQGVGSVAAPTDGGEEEEGEAMDTDATPDEPKPPSKKELKKLARDARRAKLNRARRCIAGWQKFSRQLKYRYVVSPAWTALKRADIARKKIRDVLWRGWTYRGGTGEQGPLGLVSRRDEYIFNRTENFCHHAGLGLPFLRMEKGKVYKEFPGAGDEEEEALLQAAIAESLKPIMPTPPAPMENQQGDGRTTAKATSSEAGLKTPGSARRGGKKSRGGRRTEP